MIKLTDSFLMGLGLILLVPLFVSLNQIIINELMPNSFDGSDWLSRYPVTVMCCFFSGVVLFIISTGVI